MSASQENACLKRMTPSPNAIDTAIRAEFPRPIGAPALVFVPGPSTVDVCSVFRRYIAPVLGQIFKQSIANKQGEHV
jgi:hypothetical protein